MGNDPTTQTQDPTQGQDREDVEMNISGKPFTLNVPKGLSDDDVIRRAVGVDPELDSHLSTNEKTAGIYAQEQARKKTRSGIPPPPPTGDSATFTLPTGFGQTQSVSGSPGEVKQMYDQYGKDLTRAAGTAGAFAVGPATTGMGVLGTAATEAAGAGAGAGVVSAISGNSTGDVAKDAATNAALAGGGSLAMGTALKAGRTLIGPFLKSAAVPASDAALSAGIAGRADSLREMAQAEEGVRRSIAAAPRAIRANVLAKAYPKIQTPVDIYPAASEAIQGGNAIPALRKTQAIGRDIANIQKTLSGQIDAAGAEQGLLNEAGSQMPIDPQHLDDIGQTLQDLANRKQITFGQAQNLRSAMGRMLASGQGYKLPGDVYTSVKNVNTLLDGSMRNTAAAEGKLAQWDAAQKIYKQFMADFYNQGAPLKSVVRLQPGMTGKTFGTLTKDENSVRAVAAMRRWGMDDEADALSKVLDNPNRATDLKEMGQVSTSPKAYQEAKLAEARDANQAMVDKTNTDLKAARDKAKGIAKKAIKYGVGATIGTELLRH